MKKFALGVIVGVSVLKISKAKSVKTAMYRLIRKASHSLAKQLVLYFQKQGMTEGEMAYITSVLSRMTQKADS